MVSRSDGDDIHKNFANLNEKHSGGNEDKVNINGKEKDDGSSSRVLIVVFLGLLLDLIAFAVILPLLPSLLDHYSKDNKVSV